MRVLRDAGGVVVTRCCGVLHLELLLQLLGLSCRHGYESRGKRCICGDIFHFVALLEAFVNEIEDIGLGAGVVGAQGFEVFVGLKSVALTAQDVAEQDYAAGSPIVLG